MREDSRRGAPESARSGGSGPGRTAFGSDARARASGARGAGKSGAGKSEAGKSSAGAGNAGARPGPGNRNAARGAADVARLTSVIEPVLHAMEIDLEAVKVAAAGRRRVLRIVVDADGGVSLDDIAEVSREVSARLDAKDAMGEAPYTLEVSSPGIDRPLTQPRHWRRAIGRLVVVPLDGGDPAGERESGAGPVHHEGRVIGADDDGVTLEIDGEGRVFGYGELGPGRVQVEFGRLDPVGDTDDPSELSAGEEDPGGH